MLPKESKKCEVNANAEGSDQPLHFRTEQRETESPVMVIEF
jgi:hypothetical protein